MIFWVIYAQVKVKAMEMDEIPQENKYKYD
jgi:hypothetical protein